jgi:hypothetical protein
MLAEPRTERVARADLAANFWPVSVVSSDESWHNPRHADPTCARHGVLPGQVDPSGALAAGEGRLGVRRALAQAATVRRAAPTMTCGVYRGGHAGRCGLAEPLSERDGW